MRLRFGEFVLDTTQRTLLCRDEVLTLEPKVFDCIALLASEAGNLVSAKLLYRALWPDVQVGDGALRRVINESRKALGDSGAAQRVIRTRKRLGYVFLPEVTSAARAGTTFAPWPFVGRERELQLLHDWLAASESGGLCFISGEAGAGKSSLLARLRARLPPRMRGFAGNCRASPGLPALWPFRELATGLQRDVLLRSRASAFVAQMPGVLDLLPELGHASTPKRPSSTRAEARFELCEALAAWLGDMSRVCSLALIVEDVHWADDASLMLLEAVARVARAHPLYVFASYRPEAVVAGSACSQLISRNSGRDGAVSVHLEPLNVDALCELLAVVGHQGSPARAAPWLHRVTNGNALYVHEIVRHSLASGTALEDARPPSLNHIIAERLQSLPPSTQQRLAQAAILGEGFDLAALSALAATPPEGLVSELEAAVREGVLRWNAAGDEQLQFSHALVRDALIDKLSPTERKAHHAAALRALSLLPHAEAMLGQLAVHAFEAGDQLSASERCERCELAGREAFTAALFDRAALHLGRALELSTANAASPSTAELAIMLARARWHADAPVRDVEEAFLKAAEHARQAGCAALFAEAALGYAFGDESSLPIRTASLRPAAFDLANEAWQQLASEMPGDVGAWPKQLAFRMASALCWLQVDASELAQTQRLAQRALELAPKGLDATQKLWLLCLRAVAEPEHARAWADEIVARAVGPGLDPRRSIDVLMLAMSMYFSLGLLADYERTADVIARLVELLPQPVFGGRAGERMSIYISLPLCAPVTTSVIRGQLSDAEQKCWQVVEQLQRLGFTSSRESDHGGFHLLLQLLSYLGRSSLLEPLVDKRFAADPDARWFVALLKAQFAIERGERAAAAAHFASLRDSGFRPSVGQRVVPARAETLLRLADVCVAVGTTADAALLYEALLPRAQTYVQDGPFISWGSCARPLGMLALQLHRYAHAERHFEAALAMNTRIDHRPESLRTRLGLARLMLATGCKDRARTLLVALEREATEMSMSVALMEAQTLACD